jgi:hypothetical protein
LAGEQEEQQQPERVGAGDRVTLYFLQGFLHTTW